MSSQLILPILALSDMQVIGLIVSNIVLVLAAVWRLSGSLAKIESQVASVNDKLTLHITHITERLSSVEARVQSLENRNPRSI